MLKTFFYLVLISYSPCSLFAITVPDKYKLPSNLNTIVEIHNFHNIGETTFSILFWDLYKSKLLTTSGKYPIKNETEKLIYEIHYLADISRDDLIKRTVEQWQHIGVMTKHYQVYLPELKSIWPDVNEGDTLSLLIDEVRSVFYFNQKYIGAIDKPQFGQIFLDIWLSENTSQPKLRKELLGETNNG